MSAKITINSVTLNSTPAGNQTCTVRYRTCGSVGAWTLVTAAQTVTPVGLLSPALNITGLTEGQCYEIEFKNNCGGAVLVKEITAASAEDTITFYNKLDSDTITSIKIDGGANILSSPLAAGDDIDYSAPGIFGNTHLIEVILGLADPAKVYVIVKSAETDSGGNYVNAVNAVQFSAFNDNIPSGHQFFIRNANYHLKAAQYTINEGGLVAACTIGTPAGSIDRTLSAAQDADNANANVEITVLWTPDNAEVPPTVDYVMNEGLTTIPVPAFSVSAVPCTSVTGTISGIAVV